MYLQYFGVAQDIMQNPLGDFDFHICEYISDTYELFIRDKLIKLVFGNEIC